MSGFHFCAQRVGFSLTLSLLAMSLLVLSFGVNTAFADSSSRNSHPGYLDSVTDERYQRIEEMVLVPRPHDDSVNLKAVIFDRKLTAEFQTSYEDRFGRTDAERNITSPNRFDEMEYYTGRSVTLEEDRNNRRKFAEYMMRRLTEHHMDNYFKSNPSVRKVYELKEKVSNLNVEVNKGYKLRLNYSYSGNYMDIRVENPYDIESKLRLQMGDGIGPSSVSEMILTLGYRPTLRVGLNSYIYSDAGKISLVASRWMARGMTMSLTGTTNYRYSANTLEGENMLILGLSWHH